MPFIQTNIIKWFCLFLLCFYTVILITPAFSLDKKTYTIGWEPWNPYQYKNKQKVLTGLDVELVTTIIHQMNCDINYKEIPWKRLLVYIERGKVDLAAGASKTPEREKYAYFSDGYRKEMTALFVLKGGVQKYNFKQLSDIKNSDFQLGITNGYFYGDFFASLMNEKEFKKHIQGVASDTINIKKVLKDRVQGFLGDIYAGVSAMKEAGVREKFEIHPMPVSSADVYIMFSKKTSKLEDVKLFNQTLKKLKENGTLDNILRQYID
jgi:polar amino acid transport system substrate-binding protein